MNTNKFYITVCLLGTLLFKIPFLGNAQEFRHALNDFTGYYQSQQLKALYIHFIVSGNTLKQIREWDGREVSLDQQSEMAFANKENHLEISFSKDSAGKVREVKIGGESWIKDKGYVPEKMQIDSLEAKLALDKKANALVAAINSNSADILAKFIDENFSQSLKESLADKFIRDAGSIFRFTAGLSYYKNLYHNHQAFYSEYQYKSDLLNNIYQFSLKLDKDHKIKLYNDRITSPPATDKASKPENLSKKLEKTFKALTEKDIFSGAVLVAKGNDILFTYASGEANKKSHVKNTLDTRFNLGSMNKMFTALSIMQLVEAGKINLTDPVSKYLDTTWLPKPIADQVNIHHLLSHSSGMGDFFTKAFEDTALSELLTLDGYKRFVKTDQLDFKPGTDWSYSNAGMVLLGAVIEKVSGMGYFDYVSENIYKPSGMVSAYDQKIAGNKANLALGYIPQGNNSYASNLNSAFTRSSPAGGGYSTVRDLHKFAMALISGKLVADSTKTKMFKDYFGKQYGYGFQLWGSAETKVIGHSGGAPGVSAIAYIFPDSGYIVTVLSNYDRGAAYTGEFILNEILW